MIRRPKSGDRGTWGRWVAAKRALKPQQVWAIRFWLDRERRLRDRAMFDLAIDSKLRGCDVVKVKIGDLVISAQIRSRAMVIQQKTGRSVQFELLGVRAAYRKRCSEALLQWPSWKCLIRLRHRASSYTYV